MFYYKNPQFEKKRLLRIEMLEQLRDYPRDYLEILYSDYSDGILCGCEPVWNENVLTVAAGIIRHKDKLYFMNQPIHLECEAEDRVRYLKVQFLALVYEKGQTIGNTRIYLDDKVPDPACELELCRFRLQEGARLRSSYENFADCITEFDTIHLVEVPWASPISSTLHPKILWQYATEILQKRNRDSMDTSFAMNTLANKGIMPQDVIRIYVETRLESRVGKGNRGLYLGLKKILEISGNNNSDWQRSDRTSHQVMLL